MSETFVSEYTRVKNNISAAYDAAEEMGATIPEIKNSENLINTVDSIPTGMEINGIIRQYEIDAGENINIGDFVTYVNYHLGNNTQIAANASAWPAFKHANVLGLSNNKVLIVYNYTTGSSNAQRLYGMICTISGTNITLGNHILIDNDSSSLEDISLVELSENKIFIAYGIGVTYHRAVIVTINGTTLTIGTPTVSDTYSDNYGMLSIAKLSETTVFLAYGYGNNCYLYGRICIISNMTIDLKSSYKIISNVDDVAQVVSVVALSSTKVFIGHSTDKYSGTLKGIICTINGTSIYAYTDTILSSLTASGNSIATFILSDTKIFIAHSYSNNSIGGMICTITSGYVITMQVDTELNTSRRTGFSSPNINK